MTDKIVTEAMIEAGVKAIRSLPVRPGGYVEYDAIATAAYTAMSTAQEPALDAVERFKLACLDMAKSYGLGTPESRAIVTAIEHAQLANRLQAKAPETGEG